MQVLVIALQSDIHADAVVYHLNKKGVEVFRIDPTLDDTLPQKIAITSGSPFMAQYEFQKGELNLLNCSGIFCRFGLDALAPTSEDPLVSFTQAESLSAFLALLRMVESSRWINDPWIENRVDCKTYQSYIAQSVGLKVPEFIVSSTYNDLIAFYNEHKNVIVKPLSDAPLALVNEKYIKQEQLSTTDFSAPYASPFKPLKESEFVRLDTTPAFLQHAINKKSDIRVTVIDNKTFAAEMPFIAGTQIDFRLNKNENIRAYQLPNDINEKLVELVNRLSVRFASCDLVLDKENQLFFLEANVQGNWLWTETGANLQISEAIADALLQE